MAWWQEKILDQNGAIIRKGKNDYVKVDDYIITICASSNTIITVHKDHVF